MLRVSNRKRVMVVVMNVQFFAIDVECVATGKGNE